MYRKCTMLCWNVQCAVRCKLYRIVTCTGMLNVQCSVGMHNVICPHSIVHSFDLCTFDLCIPSICSCLPSLCDLFLGYKMSSSQKSSRLSLIASLCGISHCNSKISHIFELSFSQDALRLPLIASLCGISHCNSKLSHVYRMSFSQDALRVSLIASLCGISRSNSRLPHVYKVSFS